MFALEDDRQSRHTHLDRKFDLIDPASLIATQCLIDESSRHGPTALADGAAFATVVPGVTLMPRLKERHEL